MGHRESCATPGQDGPFSVLSLVSSASSLSPFKRSLPQHWDQEQGLLCSHPALCPPRLTPALGSRSSAISSQVALLEEGSRLLGVTRLKLMVPNPATHSPTVVRSHSCHLPQEQVPCTNGGSCRDTSRVINVKCLPSGPSFLTSVHKVSHVLCFKNKVHTYKHVI